MVEVKERPKTRGDHGGSAHAIRKVGVIGAGQMGNGIAHEIGRASCRERV